MPHDDFALPDLHSLSGADPAQLYLSLLGGVQLFWAGEQVAPPGPKLLALLVYLHLCGGAGREELADVFWPGKDRKGGLQSVRQALSQLRKLPGAEGWLIEGEPGLRLQALSEVSEFRRARDAASAAALAGRGVLLAEVPEPTPVFSRWLKDERAALDVLRVEALERRADELAAVSAFEQAREYLAQAQQLEPDSEELYRKRMALEHKAGCATRGLELYEECCQMLAAEFQATPSPDTLAVLAQLEGSAAASHQRAHLLGTAATLPQSEEPLFGREAARQKLLATLEKEYALLYGLGGIGKTRLASAVAASFIELGQAVLWLEAGSDNAQTLLSTLREALRLRPEQTLEQGLEDANVGLLVLDNALSTQAARQVLAALPSRLKVLLTSRLRLPGFRALELAQLERESALQLLRHHLLSQQAHPQQLHQPLAQHKKGEGLTFNQEALCAQLGDHPFALRLAAFNIAQGGKEMLSALYAAPHNTIRTVLEQSVASVSPREYEVFLALGSLYAPHATPELLLAVLCRPLQEIEDALWQLAGRGLLSHESRASSDTLSFRMHDLTWYAAREHQAHLPLHLVAAVTQYAQSNTSNPDLLATDLPHLLGAAASAPDATLTQLMAGWLGGGYIGARGFPAAALPLLRQAAEYASSQEDWDTASLLCGKQADVAQALSGNQAEAIIYLLRGADYASKAGNAARQAVQLALAGQMEAAGGLPQGWEHLAAAQALAQSIDAASQARVLGQVAMAHAYRKEFTQAHTLLSRARDVLRSELAAFPEKGLLGAYLNVLGNLGQAEKRLGNLEAALALKQEVAMLAAEKDERLPQARAALDQGELLSELGRPAEALQQLELAISISQGIGAGGLESMARRLHQDISSAY